MYSSNPSSKIYQDKPVWNHPSQFKPKGWCDSIAGYLREANKLKMLLIANRKLMKAPYRWFVTIYVDFHQSPPEISSWWNKAKRNLARKGLNACWVREPTRTNKVHYHLLVLNAVSQPQLTTIIENSLPSRTLGRWHKNIKEVENDWRLLHYIAKAKTAGKTKSGQQVADLYSKKRLLFKKNLRIRKHGTIGKFWAKPASKIWKSIVDRERAIADGLAKPNVKQLAKHVFDFLGGGVPLQQIERNFGCFSDSDGVQNWIQQVFSGDGNI